jgi:hypothetical protein
MTSCTEVLQLLSKFVVEIVPTAPPVVYGTLSVPTHALAVPESHVKPVGRDSKKKGLRAAFGPAFETVIV